MYYSKIKYMQKPRHVSCFGGFMQRIYDKKEIAARIAGSKYRAVFDTLDAAFYMINYEKGELVSSPFQSEPLFQIVEQGAVNIYLIRDDGTRYFLSTGAAGYFLGDMDIFYPKNGSIYAEAAETLTCISFSIEKHRELLLSSSRFLALICGSLSASLQRKTASENPESMRSGRLRQKAGKGSL